MEDEKRIKEELRVSKEMMAQACGAADQQAEAASTMKEEFFKNKMKEAWIQMSDTARDRLASAKENLLATIDLQKEKLEKKARSRVHLPFPFCIQAPCIAGSLGGTLGGL